MKNILLLLLFTSLVHSDIKFYIGANFGQIKETFRQEIQSTELDSIIKMKFGYGEIDAYAAEASIDYIQNNSKVFSKTDENRYGFNIDLVKSFKLSNYLLPFIKFGFGFGQFQTSQDEDGSIEYGAYTFSTGIFIPMGESFDIELGYIYKKLSYEQVDGVSLQSKNENLYAGFNIRF